MRRVASEAYAYLAGHPFLTDTVLHNRKTDNERHIINKQHTAAEINRLTNQCLRLSERFFHYVIITDTAYFLMSPWALAFLSDIRLLNVLLSVITRTHTHNVGSC